MKGSASVPLKRGWRGLVVAVLALVFLSMLVPLVFLLGLHNGFHSGYAPEVQSSDAGSGFRNYDPEDRGKIPSESDTSKHLDELIRRLGPSISKEVGLPAEPKGSNNSEGLPIPPMVLPKPLPVLNGDKGVASDELEKSCQLEFGSYCIWSKEHKEDMKDSMVKKLKDNLFVARAYYPTIAKLPAHDMLSRELRQNIQEFERILSESSTDADLPRDVEKKLQKMEAAIGKAKSCTVDCTNVDKKLRQILDLTEDETYFHRKQSAFLYQLAIQTMPKSLHCLSMRLTVEYFRSQLIDLEVPRDDIYEDPTLHHHVIFSNHLLASSVVINSTVMHAMDSGNQVFHVITDGQNYIAMKLWFFRNSYKNATVRVLNIEDLNLTHSDKSDMFLTLSDEFRVSIRRSVDKPSSIQFRTEYISVFGPKHFLLPEIFRNLKKVVVLDDDVVVQRDLSSLWSLDMEGKVNGALEYCGVRLGQLKSYLGDNIFNSNSCAWMSGLNVIDLEKWRELNLTETYQNLLQHNRRGGGELSRVRSLPANLLAFQDQIYSLESSWVVSGLGHNYGVDPQTINDASVLHYNGNMKPWLEIGIPKYKGYWKKFLKRDDPFMDDCNVNP
ncbi:galacturonosyltransferase 7 [Tasmannia lanceolata]|uniref:galacturonosyltransferase 7 n=1 Tax=Tasmannia lanceolata TaxID=3420 RepID=UPI004062C5C8